MKYSIVLVMAALWLSACQTSKTVTNPNTGKTESVWEASIERDAKGKIIRRFIPVELFTGANWNGVHELSINTQVSILQDTMRVKTPVEGVYGGMVITRN